MSARRSETADASAVKTVAIVTRAVNYSESDRMLTLLSEDLGRVDVRARGCRKTVGRLLACSQPFCYGEFVLKKTRTGALILGGCTITDGFFSLSEDPRRLAAGVLVLNLAEEAATNGESGAELLRLLLTVLTHLAYDADTDSADITAVFLTRMMMLIGFKPELTRCVRCSAPIDGESAPPDTLIAFDIAGGGLRCPTCARLIDMLTFTPVFVHQQTLRAFRCLMEMDLARLSELRLSARTRTEIRMVLEPYTQYRVERSFKASAFIWDA